MDDREDPCYRCVAVCPRQISSVWRAGAVGIPWMARETQSRSRRQTSRKRKRWPVMGDRFVSVILHTTASEIESRIRRQLQCVDQQRYKTRRERERERRLPGAHRPGRTDECGARLCVFLRSSPSPSRPTSWPRSLVEDCWDFHRGADARIESEQRAYRTRSNELDRPRITTEKSMIYKEKFK